MAKSGSCETAKLITFLAWGKENIIGFKTDEKHGTRWLTSFGVNFVLKTMHTMPASHVYLFTVWFLLIPSKGMTFALVW